MLNTLRYILQHPLNAENRPAAIARFLRWQLANRLLPAPHIVPFVEGTVLAMERGMTGATGNWYCGLHEQADMGFVLHVLREDDLFVDIGANVGSYTVLASGAAGANTLAFEPVPSTYEKLARNVAINDLAERVTLFNLGLGSKNETLRFTSGNDTTNRVAQEIESQPTIRVQVRRLDELLGDLVPRVIKLDVEGWEFEVLKGMPETLAASGLAAMIMETNTSGERYHDNGSDQVSEMMKSYGFIAHSYDVISRQILEGGTGHNTIFIRDRCFVEGRISGARRFHLVNGIV